MILNVSYNNPQVRNKIDAEVGPPYTLKERFELKGIGSPRLFIQEASVQINNLLLLDNNRDCCNIELRPKGIILGFRSLLESYVLIIPYHKLQLYKGEAEQYSIYRDNYFVKIEARVKNKSVHAFISKLIRLRNANLGTRIEDL